MNYTFKKHGDKPGMSKLHLRMITEMKSGAVEMCCTCSVRVRAGLFCKLTVSDFFFGQVFNIFHTVVLNVARNVLFLFCPTSLISVLLFPPA